MSGLWYFCATMGTLVGLAHHRVRTGQIIGSRDTRSLSCRSVISTPGILRNHRLLMVPNGSLCLRTVACQGNARSHTYKRRGCEHLLIRTLQDYVQPLSKTDVADDDEGVPREAGRLLSRCNERDPSPPPWSYLQTGGALDLESQGIAKPWREGREAVKVAALASADKSSPRNLGPARTKSLQTPSPVSSLKAARLRKSLSLSKGVRVGSLASASSSSPASLSAESSFQSAAPSADSSGSSAPAVSAENSFEHPSPAPPAEAATPPGGLDSFSAWVEADHFGSPLSAYNTPKAAGKRTPKSPRTSFFTPEAKVKAPQVSRSAALAAAQEAQEAAAKLLRMSVEADAARDTAPAEAAADQRAPEASADQPAADAGATAVAETATGEEAVEAKTAPLEVSPQAAKKVTSHSKYCRCEGCCQSLSTENKADKQPEKENASMNINTEVPVPPLDACASPPKMTVSSTVQRGAPAPADIRRSLKLPPIPKGEGAPVVDMRRSLNVPSSTVGETNEPQATTKPSAAVNAMRESAALKAATLAKVKEDAIARAKARAAAVLAKAKAAAEEKAKAEVEAQKETK
eukprot:1181453-Prorocentrum_minimum.AAC.2